MASQKEDIMVRSPTEDKDLRIKARDYITVKAAAFENAYRNGRFQAAVYIKDSIDNVFVFCTKTGIFDDQDEMWFGTLFRDDKERRARAKVDGELFQNEVIRRLDNLRRRLREKFIKQMPQEAATTATTILEQQFGEVCK